MRPLRFDPLFAILTLAVAIYVIWEGRSGGDPATVMLGYVLLTASAVIFDLAFRLYSRLVPTRRGVDVR
ncbi:MAG: hypothetical protein EOO77_16405 [Oxalobacteraceae bacterium]|jgi:hypothetical protein|nr:MAG: hypothetical protein EOO77_16405 [Oxalobacteraceae bacterium]